MTRWQFALIAALLFVAPAFAQLPPDQALASMQPAEGLQVELFAAEPMLLNPTSIDVDHLGRVWVCEAVNYRCYLRNRPLYRTEGDRIVILADTTGDGKADKSTVFYQGTDLIAPLGIAVAKDAIGPGYKVFVCQSPDILLFHDKDGDGQADGPPEKFLTGFGGFDHDHGVHGIFIGPDSKLYFTVGDSGVTGLQSRDGTGRQWVTTREPNGDCQAGTVWRCDMDGTNLELIAHNFRNNYEACVDSFGEIWLSDNDDDGTQQTRICYVLPGGNYGYWPRGPGQSHWHEEQPGIVHKTLRTGFGSPTGICFYEGTLLPEKYRGHILHTDAGPRELRCFHRKPKGAGYELDKTLMLTSSDNWFRPSDVCVAPDGSVFVADWYDPGVGGHGMGDWTRGRIYRITPQGNTGYKVPEVKLDTKDGMLAALGSPCLATRAIALQAIQTKTPSEITDFAATANTGSDPLLIARTLWAFAPIYKQRLTDQSEINVHSAIIRRYEAEPALRTAWVRWLDGSGSFRGLLERSAGTIDQSMGGYEHDESTAVRRELILSLRTIEPAAAKRLFYHFAKQYDGQDHFYRAALNIACGTDPKRRDVILADFDKHFPEWNDTVADLVWELRPKSVLPRLAMLLDDSTLSAAQKGRIVDILAVNDDSTAGKAMLTLLTSDAPTEVKARALENLRLFLPTKWNSLAKKDDIKLVTAQLLGEPRTATTGLQLVAAANFIPAIDDVAKIAADDSAADETRIEAIRTLGKLRNPNAVSALIKQAEAGGERGIAAVAALGEQVSGRGDTPAAQQSLSALRSIVTSGEAPNSLKRSAVEALAGTQPGTRWLLSLKEKDEFPPDLLADAGRLLRNSPFQGERNKAMLLFPAPGKLDPMKLPSIAELARRKGDPSNGQRIMAKSLTSEVQCLRCHMVRGIGGQIGPDLSMIGKKGSRENLFESILYPSKAIADQYVSWQIDTTDGQSLTGLLVQETEKVIVIRDANGKDYEIPTNDIEKRSKSLVSLMPDNLVAALNEEELVDLVEYMTMLQTAALTPSVWSIAGPFSSPGGNAGLQKDFGPEKGKFDPKAKFPTGGTPSEIVWRPIRTGPGGYVDLRAFHGDAATQSVSFVYAEVESPVEQNAMILLGTDDGAKLYVNGEPIWGTNATRAAAPEQDTVSVKLKPGVNTVLLKIANGDGPHGFYMTILSEQELKSR
jgi:putative membrane-bound dehydrogenase-like protein